MGTVNPGSMKDWKDGDVVMAAEYKQERELLRVAINDNFNRLIKTFVAVNANGQTKSTTNLTAALNTLRFQEGSNVILSMNPNTATLTISVNYEGGSVGTPAIADGAVTTVKVANGAINTIKIANNAVTEPKLANNAVSTRTIQNGSVTEPKLTNGAVSNRVIQNGSVTEPKLANQSVSGRTIVNGAITNDKIANRSITEEKIQVGALDNRYYTEGEVDGKLAAKTDLTGDHKGTWQGLRVEDIDPDGFDAARITALEKQLDDSDVRDLTINERLSVIHSDRSAPLHITKLEGRTVVNHVPLFDSGLWNFHANYTVDSPTKITLNASGQSHNIARINLRVVPNTTYIVSVVMDGRLEVHDDAGTGGVIRSINSNNVLGRYSDTFTPTTDEIQIRMHGGMVAGTYTFESVAINEGTEEQEFVAGMKNLSGIYLKRYGENLIPPFNEWDRLHGGATIEEPYKLEFNPTGQGQLNTVKIPALPSTQYTISATAKTGLEQYYVEAFDSSGNYISRPLGISIIANGARTFTTPPSTSYIEVTFRNGVEIEPMGFYNPILNLGSEPLPFKPQNNDYLFADVELASRTDGSVKDVLEYHDGRYWKTKRLNKVVLDGRFNWRSGGNFAGYRHVAISKEDDFAGDRLWNDINAVECVRYDGIVLQKGNASQAPDRLGQGVWTNPNNQIDSLLISVPNEDSGWDAFVPNSNAVKALMNGWKATADDGTDYTAWESILDPSETSTDEQYVANYKATGWEGWATIQYQLADSVIEDVTDKVEGAISLHDGDNVVEMGEAVVVREVASPFVANDDLVVYINTNQSPLNRRSDSILRVYKDGLVDSNWTIVVRGANDPVRNLRGSDWARVPASMFDPSATYTVTYIAEPWQLSSAVQKVDVQYAANVKTALDRTIQNVADLSTQVSTFPSIYAKKSVGFWREPTLLNGNEIFSPGGYARYRKDGMGNVHVEAFLRIVNSSSGTIWIFAEDCRPAEAIELATNPIDSTPGSYSTLKLFPDGRLDRLRFAGNNITFSFTFAAKE